MINTAEFKFNIAEYRLNTRGCKVNIVRVKQIKYNGNQFENIAYNILNTCENKLNNTRELQLNYTTIYKLNTRKYILHTRGY